jgi:hypothetical protein
VSGPLGRWKANPHQWGPGAIHLLEEDGRKMLCGKQLVNCPGRRVTDEATCKGCISAFEARGRRAEREREWQERSREYARAQAARESEWWDQYRAYLQSPEWRARSRAVIERAHGICEACGKRAATQAHHTTYTHVGDEPLFELRAVCNQCHEKLTESDRARRQIETAGYRWKIKQEDFS